MISQRWWWNINRLLLHNNDCTSVAHRLLWPKECIFEALQKGSKNTACGVPYRCLASLCPVRLIQFIRSLDQSIVLRPMFAHNVALADVNLSTHPTHILPAVFWDLIEGCPAQSTCVAQTGFRTAQSFALVRTKVCYGSIRSCTRAHMGWACPYRSITSIRFLILQDQKYFLVSRLRRVSWCASATS